MNSKPAQHGKNVIAHLLTETEGDFQHQQGNLISPLQKLPRANLLTAHVETQTQVHFIELLFSYIMQIKAIPADKCSKRYPEWSSPGYTPRLKAVSETDQANQT